MKEQQGEQTNTYHIFKGFGEEQSDGFDSEWERAAKEMGFYSGSNALPSHTSGGGHSGSYKDNGRRGEYLPTSLNAPG